MKRLLLVGALLAFAGCAGDPATEAPILAQPGEYILEIAVDPADLDDDTRHIFATKTSTSECVRSTTDDVWLQKLLSQAVIQQSDCSAEEQQRVGNAVTGRLSCPIYLNPGLHKSDFTYTGVISEDGIAVTGSLAMPDLKKLEGSSQAQREESVSGRMGTPIGFNISVRRETDC